MSGPGATPAFRPLLHGRQVMAAVGRQWLDTMAAIRVVSSPALRRHASRLSFPVHPARLLSVLPLAFIIACAPLEPQRPPEVRTQVVEVKVPVPVPCFTEADRPILAPLTPIDIDRATVDQMAAALAADEANETLYRNAVDALFMQCLRVTGGLK